LFRIYPKGSFYPTPTTFKYYGPNARFDHHQGKGRDRRPCLSAERGICYSGLTISCCLVEVFGDRRLIEWQNQQGHPYHVALLITTRPLTLLDLRDQAAWNLGVPAAIGQCDHSLAQDWSRYFYMHRSKRIRACDGLLYSGAHNGEDAIALYERAEIALSCAPADDFPLDHPLFRPALRKIAREQGLIVSPFLTP
jgi:hypothetical protein